MGFFFIEFSKKGGYLPLLGYDNGLLQGVSIRNQPFSFKSSVVYGENEIQGKAAGGKTLKHAISCHFYNDRLQPVAFEFLTNR